MIPYINKKTPLVFILCLLFFLSKAQNQLEDPGFEGEETVWNIWGGQLDGESRSGDLSLFIWNTEAKWSGGDQVVVLPGSVERIKVGGWMKTDNVVKGRESWEMARIAIEFSNENTELLGGYPPVVIQKSGNNDWNYYERSYPVPDGATKVKVQVAIGNAVGKAWFDDLSLELYNSKGEPVQAGSMSGPLSEGEWYPVSVDPKKSGSHYVDWSGLLDAPAGKHGFLKAEDNKLVFEDGTIAKFWGTNLVAASCFPEKSDADSMASRLAKMGVNIVRLHHMDAPWANPNIFGNKAGTRKLSDESLKKLDYLIYVLKNNGIYIFLDLLVHREFSRLDGIKDTPPDLGGKQIAYFDPEIIKLQKEYARQLLTHYNPFTKAAYKDEPAIVASEFINESSIFLHFGGDILTEPYRKKLQDMFSKEYRGKKLAVFDLDYSKGFAPVVVAREETGDVAETIKFLTKVEKKYYIEMYEFLKEEVGVKYPLSGSNFPIPVLPYQKNNSELDFVIANDYWDHPQLWKINNDWSRVLYAPVNNTPMLKNPGKTVISNVSGYKWYNKPFAVTEYNYCYPNEYRLEGSPFVAAYSSLQGINGMMQFDFDQYAPGSIAMNSLSLSRHADQLAQWVVSVPMFLRGDISKAEGIVFDIVKDKELNSLPLYDNSLEAFYYLPYITKVAKAYDNEGEEDFSEYEAYHNKIEKVIKSETGELIYNYGKGVFVINSNSIQGAEGSLNLEKIELPLFSMEIGSEWISIMAVSIDGGSLLESKEFYLVVTSPVKMSGQKYNESRNALKNTGELPILAQVPKGKLFFNLPGKQIMLYPINVSGEIKEPLVIKRSNEGVLSFDLSKGRTFVYKVVLEYD